MRQDVPEILREFIIESNVPIPERGAIPELAKHLKLGDSVKLDSPAKVAHLQSSLRKRGKRGLSRKFNGYYRVWRTI